MKLTQDISSFFINLKAILPLANSHMVHFITQNMFENVLPKPIQEEINALSISELNSLVLNNIRYTALKYNDKAPKTCEFLNSAHECYLKQNSKYCLNVESLCEHLGSKGFNECSAHIVKNLMSVKKTHEVEIMSGFVAALAKTRNCSHIVDLGGGKGYLSSVLTLKHHLKVLSIDSSYGTSKSAAKRIPKVEKLWNILQKKSGTKTIDVTKKPNETALDDSSQLLKLSTLFISEETDVTKLIQENFTKDDVRGVMLVGLHTCGNLAASSLRLFTNSPMHIKCLVNIGCCYHLLVEEFDTNPSWLESESQASGFGFPMSAFLRDQGFCLGRNARMLAAQPPDRISNEGTVETEKLFYRALLEFYLEKKLPDANNSPSQWFRVGKIGRKCTSFIEYTHKCVDHLGLNIKVDDEELQQLYDSHSQMRKQLHAFFLLRLAVAPAIEAAVMLDRLLYLREQGIEDAYLTQLFDPVISPRCFAMVAFNK